MQQEKESTSNSFVRWLSVVFLVLLALLVAGSFLRSAQPFVISHGIIIVLFLMAVVVLSEAFHSLSLGQLLTLSRQVKAAEKEKESLRKDNTDLRNSLITLASNVSQSQVTTNINGLDLLLLRKALGVVPASKEDDDEEEEERESVAQCPTEELASHPVAPSQEQRDDWVLRRKIHSEIERLLLEKFAAKYGLSTLEIQKEVQFGAGIESIDPIMERRIIYDGYIKTPQKEYFIEINANGGSFHPGRSDRLYVMLAKVLFYRQAKQVEAELVLLLPLLPDESQAYQYAWRSTRSLEWFQPAISNGLLRVESFPVNKDEYMRIREQAERETAS